MKNTYSTVDIENSSVAHVLTALQSFTVKGYEANAKLDEEYKGYKVIKEAKPSKESRKSSKKSSKTKTTKETAKKRRTRSDR